MQSGISKFIQTLIQSWLTLTGKRVDFAAFPFLKGPMAGDEAIGEAFYHKLAEQEGLQISHAETGGLLGNFLEVLDPDHPFYDRLDPEIPVFYEQTATYSLEVWSQWKAPISWFAKLLIRIVSSEMKQLNMPLDPLETSYGMGSSVIHLSDEEGDIQYACWLRKSLKTQKVVYAGFYSGVQLGDHPHKHVRVVFPMPKGNVTVLLKVELLEDGSVRLVSDGKRFGETGYYRMHRTRKGVIKAQMMPIKEVIHVFRDPAQVLRTDHSFSFWKIPFLQLHYKIMGGPQGQD